MKEPASFFILWQKNESGEPKKLFWPPKKFSMNNRLQVSLIVHLFVKNTIYAYRTVIPLFVEDNVMPDLETKEPGLYDIIFLFKEDRQTVQSLNRAIYLPIIDDRLIFRPGLGGVVPDAIQIGNGFSG